MYYRNSDQFPYDNIPDYTNESSNEVSSLLKEDLSADKVRNSPQGQESEGSPQMGQYGAMHHEGMMHQMGHISQDICKYCMTVCPFLYGAEHGYGMIHQQHPDHYQDMSRQINPITRQYGYNYQSFYGSPSPYFSYPFFYQPPYYPPFPPYPPYFYHNGEGEYGQVYY